MRIRSQAKDCLIDAVDISMVQRVGDMKFVLRAIYPMCKLFWFSKRVVAVYHTKEEAMCAMDEMVRFYQENPKGIFQMP